MSRWYTGILVMRACVDGEWHDESMLDHQVRLIRAADPETAYLRALALGAAEVHSYLNADGRTVSWEFVGLGELQELLSDHLTDGVEVFSWLTSLPVDVAVLPKERLSIFLPPADATRRASDFLDDDLGPAI